MKAPRSSNSSASHRPLRASSGRATLNNCPPRQNLSNWWSIYMNTSVFCRHHYFGKWISIKLWCLLVSTEGSCETCSILRILGSSNRRAYITGWSMLFGTGTPGSRNCKKCSKIVLGGLMSGKIFLIEIVVVLRFCCSKLGMCYLIISNLTLRLFVQNQGQSEWE